MSKKTHWERVAEFKLGDFHDFEKNCAYTPTPEQKKAYQDRMFKWGTQLSRMKPNKVSFKKKKEANSKEEE